MRIRLEHRIRRAFVPWFTHTVHVVAAVLCVTSAGTYVGVQVRRLGNGVIAGFAGATADALTLFERLEAKLEEHPGMIRPSAPCSRPRQPHQLLPCMQPGSCA